MDTVAKRHFKSSHRDGHPAGKSEGSFALTSLLRTALAQGCSPMTPMKLTLALAALVAGTLSISVPASAGSCPAGKETTTDGQKPGATAHKDVNEQLLGEIDLSKEKIAV